jgi:signal transduction histidine kinase
MKRLFVFLFCIVFSIELFGADQVVKIGILALRGKDNTHLKWDETAKYLTHSILGFNFKIIPLNFSEIDSALEKKEIDFLLVNSSIYVKMEYKYQIGRIATLKRKTYKNEAVSIFGGVIFTKSTNKDINSFNDFKGKNFAAVDKTSFGGWHMAWYEMEKNGFEPVKDFKSLVFSGTHDKVVYDVLSGKVDIGTVRTGVLESMAAEKKIKLSDIKVLFFQKCGKFNILNSTKCYPEWPMAKLQNTSDTLANKVAIALISMNSENIAARSADIGGWTIPYNYQPVHEIRKALHLSPYDKKPEITLSGVFKKYWSIIVLGFFITLISFVAIARISRLNSSLRKSEAEIRKNYDTLKNMQDQLVESEKMASLGGLVAGVSHEINTPVGLALTSVTHLCDEFQELVKKYENAEMSEDDFTGFISLYNELGHSIIVNLNRAANLVQSFKQVAVDQSSEALREFNIKEYIEEVLNSLYNRTKKTKHYIELSVDPRLKIESYPGAFSQIITNLVMNSLIHGYDQDVEGHITIKVEKKGNYLELFYSDDGKGIPKENLKKIYDPFFTTNRENGGSGLGMNIVFNIVGQKLKGGISCKSDEGHGVKFTIMIPYFIERKQ